MVQLTYGVRLKSLGLGTGHSPVGICLFVRRDEVVICHKINSCTLVLLDSWTLGLLSRVLSCMCPNSETSPSV